MRQSVRNHSLWPSQEKVNGTSATYNNFVRARRERFFESTPFRFRVGVRSCMKRFVIPVLIVTLSASPVLAENSAPLEPGKPAGVRQAELLDGGNGMFVVAGAALVGITIALATAENGPAAAPNTNPATSTTGTTP
jgi:hypothetical protein